MKKHRISPRTNNSQTLDYGNQTSILRHTKIGDDVPVTSHDDESTVEAVEANTHLCVSKLEGAVQEENTSSGEELSPLKEKNRPSQTAATCHGEWEIVKILNARDFKVGKGEFRKQYLVRWKDTWESSDNLENASGAVREYHARRSQPQTRTGRPRK